MTRPTRRICPGRNARNTGPCRTTISGDDVDCARCGGRAKPRASVRVTGHAADGREIVESPDGRYVFTRPNPPSLDPAEHGASAYDGLDAAGRCEFHVATMRDFEATAGEAWVTMSLDSAETSLHFIAGHAIRAFVALLEFFDLAHLADDGMPLDERELTLLAHMSRPPRGEPTAAECAAAYEAFEGAPASPVVARPSRRKAVEAAAHVMAPVGGVVDRDMKPENVASILTLPGLDSTPRGRRAPPVQLRQKDLGQFFTPPWLAAEVAKAGNVRGLAVLEPSAGSGNIVAALLDAGAAHVTACEIDPLLCARLRERFAGSAVTVVEGDFLAIPLRSLDHVHAIAGNPPYDGGMDSDHLARIADMIEFIERRSVNVVEASLLLRTVVLHSQDRYARVWSRLAVRDLAACPDRIAFEIDGVTGEAGKIDVSIFRLGAIVPGEVGVVRHVRAPMQLAAVGT